MAETKASDLVGAARAKARRVRFQDGEPKLG